MMLASSSANEHVFNGLRGAMRSVMPARARRIGPGGLFRLRDSARFKSVPGNSTVSHILSGK